MEYLTGMDQSRRQDHQVAHVTRFSILDPGQVPEIKGVTRWEQTKSFVNFELILLGSRLTNWGTALQRFLP